MIRVFIRNLFSKSTHIPVISFQEKMRPVVMRLLGKIVVTRIVVYVMFNNLSMISGNFALGF